MKAAAGGGAPEMIVSQARKVGLANDVEGNSEGGFGSGVSGGGNERRRIQMII